MNKLDTASKHRSALGGALLSLIWAIVLPTTVTAADPIPLGSGTAAQSSQLGGFDAGRALDEIANFTHTLSSDQASTWQVLLPEIYTFETVEIFNRDSSDGTTGCCPSRLRDITIQIVRFEGDVTTDFTNGEVIFASPLLNPENVLGGGVASAGPVSLLASPDRAVGNMIRIIRRRDDDNSGTGGAGNSDEAGVLSLDLVTATGRVGGFFGPAIKITDISHDATTGMLSISWESNPAKLYDILANPDLSTPIANWPELAGAQDIPGDPSGLNTVAVALPFPGKGFVAVREEEPPPLFLDDLESGAPGWTTVVNDGRGNTEWQLGVPVGSTGPLTGAGGSDNAWCTNLGDYGPDSDISLRSPAIDLTNLPGALLSFDAFRDADGFADEATVRFLRADDQTQLGADVPIDMTVFDIDYLNVEVPVPAEAIGESILVEFNFLSDGGGDLFSGLTLDNISVKAN
ncbi:MAG: hypothetical protein CL922_03085 [Deltaproteobacteria bacterium]|nr:hypothetical protein [Deltaproteobacteria bacterium]